MKRAVDNIPFEETASFALAAALLGLAVTRMLPLVLALPLVGLVAGFGAVTAVRRRRAAARERELADDVIVTLPGVSVPDGLSWRAKELVAPEHRRFLARQLHRFAEMGRQRMLITSVPVYLDTLRPNARELEEIADVVERVDEPIPPRALVLVEQLLADGEDSPLYRPAQAEELGEALHTVHDALGRRAA